jgi:mono/diheme cytochrome c family protein
MCAVFAVLIRGLGFSVAPSNGHAQSKSVAISSGATSATSSVHDARPIASASLYAVTTQNGATPPPATPSQAKQVELPEGEGKAIATEYCKDCHALTNVTKAQKSLGEWRKYLQSLMDRGGRLPQESDCT